MDQQTDLPEERAPEPAKVSMRLACDAGRFTLWLEEFVRHEAEKRGAAGRKSSLELIVVDDRQHLQIAQRLPGDEELPAPGLAVRDDFEGYFYWVLVKVIEVMLTEADGRLDVTVTAFLPGQLGGLAERLLQRATKELGGGMLIADGPAHSDGPDWFPKTKRRRELWTEKADLMERMDHEYQELYDEGTTDSPVVTFDDYRERIVSNLHDTHNGDDTLRNIRRARQNGWI